MTAEGRRSGPLRQLALQAGAALLALATAGVAGVVASDPLSWGALAVAAGVCAGGVAWLTGQPVWWRVIHFGFLPLAWAVVQLRIEPGWFLAAFVVSLLVFRGAVTGRVPLYLSNARTAARLAQLAEERRAERLIDLGAGIGSVAFRVARARPVMAVTGVENAPLTWAVGEAIRRWRGLRAVDWRYGGLWEVGLGGFDLVYAFLSPEPMPALWDKARAEMAPGSLLVSNSFPVPGIEPWSILEVEDDRGTRLYCYLLQGRDPPVEVVQADDIG